MVVDLARPNRPQTLGGKVYDMVIVDTFSQRSFVKLVSKKTDAADMHEVDSSNRITNEREA